MLLFSSSEEVLLLFSSDFLVFISVMACCSVFVLFERFYLYLIEDFIHI